MKTLPACGTEDSSLITSLSAIVVVDGVNTVGQSVEVSVSAAAQPDASTWVSILGWVAPDMNRAVHTNVLRDLGERVEVSEQSFEVTSTGSVDCDNK